MVAVTTLPQPVIAKVHGIATAAGCQLVASCDLVVASTAAKFATPGVQIGLFCSTPAVALVRAVGRKRAMHMLLTGDMVDGAPTAPPCTLGTGSINGAADSPPLDLRQPRMRSGSGWSGRRCGRRHWMPRSTAWHWRWRAGGVHALRSTRDYRPATLHCDSDQTAMPAAIFGRPPLLRSNAPTFVCTAR
jgi:hypothetical protein